MGLTLVGEDKNKQQLLIEAASSTKSSYAAWIYYFDEGKGSCNGLVLKALLAYWLSMFIFPSKLEDGPNSYVLSLVIILEKGKNVALVSNLSGVFIRTFRRLCCKHDAIIRAL